MTVDHFKGALLVSAVNCWEKNLTKNEEIKCEKKVSL